MSTACAAAAWLVGEPLLVRSLATLAAVTAIVGAVLLRRWDNAAGKRVADLNSARLRDEWRAEERVAELETGAEQARAVRNKLEGKLRARRAELARLRNEHAALLRRYATAETARAKTLEDRRRLAVGSPRDEVEPASAEASADLSADAQAGAAVGAREARGAARRSAAALPPAAARAADASGAARSAESDEAAEPTEAVEPAELAGSVVRLGPAAYEQAAAALRDFARNAARQRAEAEADAAAVAVAGPSDVAGAAGVAGDVDVVDGAGAVAAGDVPVESAAERSDGPSAGLSDGVADRAADESGAAGGAATTVPASDAAPVTGGDVPAAAGAGRLPGAMPALVERPDAPAATAGAADQAGPDQRAQDEQRAQGEQNEQGEQGEQTERDERGGVAPAARVRVEPAAAVVPAVAPAAAAPVVRPATSGPVPPVPPTGIPPVPPAMVPPRTAPAAAVAPAVAVVPAVHAPAAQVPVPPTGVRQVTGPQFPTGQAPAAGAGQTTARPTEATAPTASEHSRAEAPAGPPAAAAPAPAAAPVPTAAPAPTGQQAPARRAPQHRPASRAVGGFDFFGTATAQEPPAALEDDLADVVGAEAIADHVAHAQDAPVAPEAAEEQTAADGEGVIDLTAHDETEQIDMAELRGAIS
ncbi:hypothetical protein ACMA1D_18850 [Streptomyces sp. 796.1]|uniref:hypothetical protein n=1 Tax=Streptomyces sp. 796.1 TaxID=3163029 RepID=UPI0039C9458D